MTLRYVISFPAGTDISQQQMHHFQERLKEAANAKEWRDIVLNEGGTITDVRRRVPIHIKHAQRWLR